MPSGGSGLPTPQKSSDQSGGSIGSEVRNELQRFVEDILQPQLSQFAESLRQEVVQPQLSLFAERLQRDLCEELKHCLQDSPRSERSEPEKNVTLPTGDLPDLQKVAALIPPEAAPGCPPQTSQKEPGYLQAPSWVTFTARLEDDRLEDEAQGKAGSGERADEAKAEVKHISTQGAMLGRSHTLSERSQKVNATGPPRAITELIVTSRWFERAVAMAILLNAIYIGIVTQYMAVNELAATPLAFQVIEGIFLVVFAAEISLKLYVYRCSLFSFRTPSGVRNEQMYWNLLDCLIIGLQVVETILSFFTQDAAFNGLTVLRVLRLLRLVRIVRIVKVMRFVADLNMIIYSIWRSISLFFWSVVALGMLNFICSVYFTEFVLTSKVNNSLSNKKDIDKYFGSLTTTMISLFQAVTGGVDWGDMTDVLSVSSEWAIVPFLVYVAFNQIAMLNVISGVFLETAMEIARDEKDTYVVRNARLVFSAVDHNKNGTITWEDFQGALHHPHMINFFEAVDIRPSEARTLFDLLDISGDGSISADEFLNGCLRVRGPSKALDLLVLSREVACLFEKHVQNAEMLQQNKDTIRKNRKAIMLNREAIKYTGKSVETVGDDAKENSPRAPSPAHTDDKLVPSASRSNTWGRDGAAETNDGEPFSASLPGQCPP